MDLASIPTFLPIPFASSAGTGYINVVPQTASPTAGLASYTTGFVPANFEPIASGGIPPSGGDFNGVFFDITTRVRWAQAGGGYPYDSTFSTAIGGYPKGALVLRSDSTGQWLSTVDNNTTDPDSSGAAGWVAMRANTGSAAITATSGTVSPTKTQLGAQVLIVSGTLTANANLQLPLTAGAQWTVVNNTTGAFTLTVGGPSGTTTTVTAGTGIIAYTDGTNYYSITAALSGAYLPIGGTAVAATKLATARNIAMSGDVTWTVSFDGSANATAAGAIGVGAVTLAKMANLTGNTLIANPTGSSAVPQAVTLANGLAFSGTTLGMGAITPSSVSASGNISTTGQYYSIIYGGNTGYFQMNAGGVTPSFGLACANSAVPFIVSLGGSAQNLLLNSSGLALSSGQFIGNTSFAILSTSGTSAGTVYLRPNGYSTATGQTTISSTGNVVASGTITPGSDERIKDNIQPITGGLETVRRALVGVEYDRNDQGGAHDAGFSAQRVKEHLPHLVLITDTHGFKDFHSMNYNGAVAYLSSALTELHDIVIKQQAMIDELMARGV